jgi:hypothetical protein
VTYQPGDDVLLAGEDVEDEEDELEPDDLDLELDRE